MARNGLKELYIDELKDLYDAENRLVKALPKMAKPQIQRSFGLASRSTWSRLKDMWIA